jgi:TetR/AcrR family transcriptional regulator, transcriptional repressor for nem operon
MRHSREKKAENRELVLQAAARLFRERGIPAVSVADVMRAAELTHGGFYRHFANKEELVAEAIAYTLSHRNGSDALHEFTAEYLSTEHRDGVGDGCVFAALGAEAQREPAARTVLADSIAPQIADWAASLTGGSDEQRRTQAIGTWSTLIGAIILARTSNDPELSREILEKAKSWIASKSSD